MSDIKKYSSNFATKLMYLVSECENDGKKSLVDQACDSTDEKETTVRNWLFNGKIPRLPKRLSIADAVGVSIDYLFNDNISIDKIEKPKIHKEDGRYLIPFISEEDVFKINQKSLLPIHNRIPIMFPNFDKMVSMYGDNIYATKINKSNFKPHIEDGSTVLFTDNLKFEEYKFVLIQVKNKLSLRRLIKSEKGFGLMYYSELGDEIIEPANNTSNILLVIIAFCV